MEQGPRPEEPPRLLASYRRIDFIRLPRCPREGKSAGLLMVLMMIF